MSSSSTVEPAPPAAPAPATSDEAEYLRRYPDVAAAVRRGRFKSGRDHFDLHGRFEGRAWPDARPGARPAPAATLGERPRPDPEQSPKPPTAPHSFDAVVSSPSGIFIEGWLDDRAQRTTGIEVVDLSTGRRAQTPFYRCRRTDVEAALSCPKPYEFGFWTVLRTNAAPRAGSMAVKLTAADGAQFAIQPNAELRLASDEFFEHLLSFYGRKAVLGNAAARSFSEFDLGFGETIAELYGQMAAGRRVVTTADFGLRPQRPEWSLVCVLYGVPDFLYLLVAQFARFMRLDGVEFIFVSNSPELDETLVRDAELASLVFGAQVRVITLNQNCGFSYANNVGVRAARSRDIAVINPDVFPRNAAACQALGALGGGALGRDIVGGKLFYADGTVMHEGMYFVRDEKLAALADRPIWTVEHFRKGFPDLGDTAQREVPAVTGALMLFRAETFEAVGGFDEKFVYGHYEDADLCMRVAAAGGRVLYDPRLAYWHYEGKGSIKRPEHAGSGFFNRWRFAQVWGSKLEEAYGGRDAF
jgi:GT2 family glycosyltransferase